MSKNGKNEFRRFEYSYTAMGKRPSDCFKTRFKLCFYGGHIIFDGWAAMIYYKVEKIFKKSEKSP